MRPLTRFLLLAAAALPLLSACSHYTPLPERAPVRVALLPVVNESELPQVIAPLARNLREGLAHSPRWILADEASAEASLRVTVRSLNRQALARDPEDTGRPLSYRETLIAEVEWISDLPAPWGGAPVIQVEADQSLYAQPGLVEAETMATAEFAERLAGRILQQLDWAGEAR